MRYVCRNNSISCGRSCVPPMSPFAKIPGRTVIRKTWQDLTSSCCPHMWEAEKNCMSSKSMSEWVAQHPKHLQGNILVNGLRIHSLMYNDKCMWRMSGTIMHLDWSLVIYKQEMRGKLNKSGNIYRERNKELTFQVKLYYMFLTTDCAQFITNSSVPVCNFILPTSDFFFAFYLVNRVGVMDWNVN